MAVHDEMSCIGYTVVAHNMTQPNLRIESVVHSSPSHIVVVVYAIASKHIISQSQLPLQRTCKCKQQSCKCLVKMRCSRSFTLIFIIQMAHTILVIIRPSFQFYTAGGFLQKSWEYHRIIDSMHLFIHNNLLM